LLTVPLAKQLCDTIRGCYGIPFFMENYNG
jgi:hypothetical protein